MEITMDLVLEPSIALEVVYQGDTHIYNPSFRTSWQDLLAMLKCCFDVEDIVVCYLDDEDDEIAIDTQDEYDEAKKISNKQHNVIRLRVYQRDQRMEVDDSSVDGPISTTVAVEESKKRKRVDYPVDPPPTPTPTPPEPQHPPPSAPRPIPTLAICPPMPPPRPRLPPRLPPRLNRATSVPSSSKQAAVTGCVKKAVRELKQMNHTQPELPETPVQEKELIHQIVKGVLEGLDGSMIERSRHQSEPSEPQGGSIPSPSNLSQSAEAGARPKTTASSQEPKFEHTSVHCDRCQQVIFGIRYKCGHCLDFDLCEDCESLPSPHDPNHVFLKLKRPAYHVGMKSDGTVAPIFNRPVYADDDTPLWEYKIKKLKEKYARKAARAELKRKFRDEKRKVKQERECHTQVTPTKREKIEQMAEKQAEQIMAAASIAATPATTGNVHALSPAPIVIPKFDAGFMRDGNLPDDTHMQPKTKFVKSWILLNNGNVKWNADTKLKYLWGDIKLLSPEAVAIPPLSPGEEGPICVDFEAPELPGRYQSHWRLTQQGEQFGHRVWCNVIVDRAEVLEPVCEKKKTVQEEMILPKIQESGTVQGESNENTPSSAVAHLQTDQSDSNSLARVVSSSDVLTAQDVLSFELLSIHDDQDADKEVAGVNSPTTMATPNNTPIVGLTPCISPIPQLDEKLLCRRVSEHSDLEIVNIDLEIVHREDVPEIREGRDDNDMSRHAPISEQVHEGVEVAGCFSVNDDLESICSSSDSDILDDYCVVPLPDCFDPSKPLDKSLIQSRTSLSSSLTSSVLQAANNAPLVRLPSYEESQAERESLSASGSSTPDAVTPVPQTNEPPIFAGIACTDEEALPPRSEEVESAKTGESDGEIKQGVTSVSEPSVDSLLSTSNPALETTPLIPILAATPLPQQQREDEPQPQQHTPTPKSTSPAPQTVSMAPMPEITLLASPATVPTISEGGVLINPEGSVIYEARATHTVTSPVEVVSETRTASVGSASDGAGVTPTEVTVRPQAASPRQSEHPEGERQDDHEEEFHDAQDSHNDQDNDYGDVQYQSDPVDLLGYTAARAVEVAGSVVRQAFDTAASSVNALLRPQPIPMPAPYQPTGPAQYQPPSPTPMEQLIEMGFGDRTKNQQLLEKYNDNISLCVQDLLQAVDNDWSNNRH